MVREMLAKKSTHRDKINGDHRTKYLLDRYMDTSASLLDLYEDKDGLRKAEHDQMAGPNEFSEFYSRLRDIKEFFKKHPNEVAVPMSQEFEDFEKSRDDPNEQNLVEFTDEEGYGKYLDLNLLHDMFLNLKGIDRVDYLTYVEKFDHLFEISKDKKMNSEYVRYLEALIDYLSDYLLRVRPLSDVDDEFRKAKIEFDVQWDHGTFPGWPKEKGSALVHSGASLDLSVFSSWEELMSLGLDRLKSALMALRLKCGGTLEERAQRLWATKGKSIEEIDPSLFAKKGKGLNKMGNAGGEREREKEIAFLEAKIYRLSELLSEERAATKENVQRKQARTVLEREESDEEDAEVSEDDDDAQDEVVYNPKNLPLGWDGKPIPYWLYKLHGLNISYTCEICGNAIYKGPKAFQRHFAEWRHAHGMRCLGIPNTAHFANITQIEDALKLWNKLKEEKTKEKFNPSNEEEFEDSSGNVVTKKTYEDLKRQGLL